MSDWIPFHRSLISGAKKSWPRSARFVLMELAIHARAHRGVIKLPVAWRTAYAVHQILGGNSREIREAIELMQQPDEEGVPVIRVERSEFAHTITMPKWRDHVFERRRPLQLAQDDVDPTWKRRENDVRTTQERRENDVAKTVEKKEVCNVVELQTTKASHSTVQDITEQNNPQITTPRAVSTAKSRAGSQHRGSRIPEGWTPASESYAKVVAEFGLDEKFVARALDEFRDHWVAVAGAQGTKVSWEATFRNRLRYLAERRTSQPRFRAAAPVQPAAKPGEYDWQKAAGVDGKDF